MTQERFIEFLENPEGLSAINYEELKTLALAYPYAHNLRYLLALKSQQNHHPEAQRNLATAAAHSLDRTRLFALIAPPQLTPQRLKEEVLELKPIETIRRELEALSPLSKEKTIEKQSVAARPNTERPPVAAPPTQPEPILSGLALPSPTHRQPQPFSDWIGAFNPPILRETPLPKTTTPTTDIAILQSTEDETSPTTKSVQHHDTPNQTTNTGTRSIAQELAERSVAENKDVISETLARLLAKQGHRDRAIAMYERLGLAFPEKSSFFAAEIDKLKK